MCKNVFHSLLNFAHITEHFCLSPIPKYAIDRLQNVGRRPQIWPAQQFWRGAPYSTKCIIFTEKHEIFLWMRPLWPISHTQFLWAVLFTFPS